MFLTYYFLYIDLTYRLPNSDVRKFCATYRASPFSCHYLFPSFLTKTNFFWKKSKTRNKNLFAEKLWSVVVFE